MPLSVALAEITTTEAPSVSPGGFAGGADVAEKPVEDVIETPADSTSSSRIDVDDVKHADVEQADTVQLNGITTRAELPRELPNEWVKRGMFRPVCPWHLALHGLLDLQEHWEALGKARLISVGFEQLPDLHSDFWHPGHTFSIVYDDDFKLSGPKDKLQIGWDLIAKTLGLNLDCNLVASSAPTTTQPKPD